MADVGVRLRVGFQLCIKLLPVTELLQIQLIFPKEIKMHIERYLSISLKMPRHHCNMDNKSNFNKTKYKDGSYSIGQVSCSLVIPIMQTVHSDSYQCHIQFDHVPYKIVALFTENYPSDVKVNNPKLFKVKARPSSIEN